MLYSADSNNCLAKQKEKMGVKFLMEKYLHLIGCHCYPIKLAQLDYYFLMTIISTHTHINKQIEIYQNVVKISAVFCCYFLHIKKIQYAETPPISFWLGLQRNVLDFSSFFMFVLLLCFVIAPAYCVYSIHENSLQHLYVQLAVSFNVLVLSVNTTTTIRKTVFDFLH